MTVTLESQYNMWEVKNLCSLVYISYHSYCCEFQVLLMMQRSVCDSHGGVCSEDQGGCSKVRT